MLITRMAVKQTKHSTLMQTAFGTTAVGICTACCLRCCTGAHTAFVHKLEDPVAPHTVGAQFL